MFLSNYFATFGSIKENPNGQVTTEILETMFNTRRSKKNICRVEWCASLATNKFTAPSGSQQLFGRLSRVVLSYDILTENQF